MSTLSVRFTVDDVRYDPETHTSTLPDGRPVPHVTAVLRAVGASSSMDGVPEALLAHAGARGTAAHADCHAYDDGDLDFESVDQRVAPYLDAWIICRENIGLEPLVRERRLYAADWNYTGIMDGVFVDTRRGLNILVDIKTGNPEDAAAHQQTAAYEYAYRQSREAVTIHERWAIWLRPDLAVPYRILNYSARPDAFLDEMRWISSLTVYGEQFVRRQKVVAA